MIKFDLPKDEQSIIKVIGVGGGGGNAVNFMYKLGITGVEFAICNTDAQALALSPVPLKIQLGAGLTEGRGAGANPEIGRSCTLEAIDEVKNILEKDTRMLFVTAGMGGGTGTGGAPVVAKAAKELGILTVGIVTCPFTFEGSRRRKQAEEGLRELKEHVDTLLVINNDKVREIHGNLKYSEAFAQADSILANAAKGIAEIITVPGYVNVDFEDVKTVMRDSGIAIMGSAVAEGENRALEAIESALNSPLLNNNDIAGANYILLNIGYGEQEVLMDEITEIMDYVQEIAGSGTDIIWGNCYSETLGDKLSVIIIATGFDDRKSDDLFSFGEKPKKVVNLVENKKEATPTPTTGASKTNSANEPVKKVHKLEDDVKPLTYEFDVNKNVRDEQKGAPTSSVTNTTNDIDLARKDEEDMEKKRVDRVAQLKKLSVNLKKNPGQLSELENVPAYLRRNVKLEDSSHSSDETNMSRYTLSDPDEEGKPEIRKNNSFLHDNVD